MRTSLLLALLAGSATGAASAQATDIYVVYLGYDRTLLSDVVEHIPREWNVKTYKADLIALADHTGAHRIANKLQHSDFVVFVGNDARQSFRHTFSRYHNSVTLTEENHEAAIQTLIDRMSAP